MDFMLEEELMDLLVFCLQNPTSPHIQQKQKRITEIGQTLYDDGGVDAMENFFFAVKNRIIGEINQDPEPFRKLWSNIDPAWDKR